MSIIKRFLAVVTEPQFKLARDLTAMAIADGQVTTEEKDSNVSPDRNLLEAPFPPEGNPPFPVAWGPCVVHGSCNLSRDHCLKGGAHA